MKVGAIPLNQSLKLSENHLSYTKGDYKSYGDGGEPPGDDLADYLTFDCFAFWLLELLKDFFVPGCVLSHWGFVCYVRLHISIRLFLYFRWVNFLHTTAHFE